MELGLIVAGFLLIAVLVGGAGAKLIRHLRSPEHALLMRDIEQRLERWPYGRLLQHQIVDLSAISENALQDPHAPEPVLIDAQYESANGRKYVMRVRMDVEGNRVRRVHWPTPDFMR